MGLPDVLTHIQSAAAQAGRPADSVRLVAVTKGRLPEDIRRHVLAYGRFPLAENRGQELRDKKVVLPGAEWHFIGPLQPNKVKYLQGVTLVHTIEALWQAEAIARAAERWGQAPAVLLQVHNGEAQKHGAAPAELVALLRQTRATGLEVRGLMVMAPYDQPAEARRIFADTARRAHDLGLGELSMGMSDDYPQAIAVGATLVRIGTSLFT